MNLLELKRLAENTVGGPWFSNVHTKINGVYLKEEYYIHDGETIGYVQPGPLIALITPHVDPNIRHFIAAANPTAILELIKQVEEYEEALKKIDRDDEWNNVGDCIDIARAVLKKYEEMK